MTQSRNEQIIERIARAGKKRGIFQEVADEFGITRQRVYAIWGRANAPQYPKPSRAELTGRLPGVNINRDHEAIIQRMVVEMGWETISHAVRLAVGILVLTDVAALQSQAQARNVDPAALAARAINDYLAKLAKGE